ncbi:FAD dependent oxidoreductase [Daldinia caldariorum]|uniref:FAD dependent oxidoreductase n=1 Tax=Daldinia caldariorum TaxID=326644 RepID=UPI002007D7EC|nr:FAD dependent oxidoreductase [Daldinia caldariorum]KAI1463964.1 FAD dependent oxidoreductase [Daldinia caldariorum]
MAQAQLLEGQSGLPVDNPTKSYWHKEPSSKLLGHRTTKELPRSADVVIVGSGITGSFAAHFLKEKQPDLNVVMVEAREACSGATGRNGGHCQPAIYSSNPHIASFELRNFLYLKGLVEEFSIPCDWRSTSGVHTFYSKELFETCRHIVDNLTEDYPDLAANVAVVTKGKQGEGDLSGSPAYLLEGERRELTLGGLRIPHAEGAIVQWNAASLWPYKLVAFLLERLLAANEGGSKGSFNLQTNTPVTGLSRAETSANLSSPGNSKTRKHNSIWTVHTPRGTIVTSQVLLATNGYTSHLLPQFSDLLVPTRGQISALKPPETPTDPADPPLDIGHTYYVVGEPVDPYSRDDYLVQRPPPAAELIFGGGRQHAAGRGIGVWDDSGIDESVSWYLRGELSNAIDLSLHHTQFSGGKVSLRKLDLEPTFEWSGIMGYTRDSHPWVGGVPASLGGGSGLWLCAGYTGHGMPNAVLSAKAVVDMLLADDDDDDVEIDLPPEYELTERRVNHVREGWEDVAVADAKGSLYMDFGPQRW